MQQTITNNILKICFIFILWTSGPAQGNIKKIAIYSV